MILAHALPNKSLKLTACQLSCHLLGIECGRRQLSSSVMPLTAKNLIM